MDVIDNPFALTAVKRLYNCLLPYVWSDTPSTNQHHVHFETAMSTVPPLADLLFPSSTGKPALKKLSVDAVVVKNSEIIETIHVSQLLAPLLCKQNFFFR